MKNVNELREAYNSYKIDENYFKAVAEQVVDDLYEKAQKGFNRIKVNRYFNSIEFDFLRKMLEKEDYKLYKDSYSEGYYLEFSSDIDINEHIVSDDFSL